jgi:hypothetical protein
MRMALVSSPAVLPRNQGARNFLNDRSDERLSVVAAGCLR